MGKSHTPILLFLALTCACVKQAPPALNDDLPSQVQSIVVLPVALASTSADGTGPKNKELPSGVEVLTQAIEESVATNAKVRIMSAEELESLQSKDSYTVSAGHTEALRIGASLGADAVMLWELKHYRDRKGTDYAATSPASVAFDYRLIHTESGKTLCAGSFSETQESATENLLSLKKLSHRGFKWIPASELTREGVAQKLTECGYLK